jgi:peptidyl-prolyl cis-trans isomerase C
MNKQMKLIFPAVFAVALFAVPNAPAASANAAATNAPASTATNAKPADAMTALFGDPVIAKGKGFEIKRSELDEVMTGVKSTAAARGQTIPAVQLTRIESQMLDQIIQEQLLLQKATEADRTSGNQKADLQMSNLLARVGSQEAFDRQMKAMGMTTAELRSKAARKFVAWSMVLPRELNITVTDAEVNQFYNDTNNLADFEQPEQARLRNILTLTIDPVTRTPLSKEQQQAKRKMMDDILKRIRAGEDFVALAKQYSEDPDSKNKGGELPLLSREQMGPELAVTAFSLTNNQVSGVVETTYGYHIVKLLNKTPAKKLTLTDKVPMTDATIASRIKDYLTQRDTEKLAPPYLEKLQKSAEVQILDSDLKAAAATRAAAANAPAATREK